MNIKHDHCDEEDETQLDITSSETHRVVLDDSHTLYYTLHDEEMHSCGFIAWVVDIDLNYVCAKAYVFGDGLRHLHLWNRQSGDEECGYLHYPSPYMWFRFWTTLSLLMNKYDVESAEKLAPIA